MFSVLQASSLPTWAQIQGWGSSQWSATREKSLGSSTECPACVRHHVKHSTEAIIYPENTSCQLTRWHYPIWQMKSLRPREAKALSKLAWLPRNPCAFPTPQCPPRQSALQCTYCYTMLLISPKWATCFQKTNFAHTVRNWWKEYNHPLEWFSICK